jgi:hypothetical protein
MLLDGKVVRTVPDGQTLALVRDRLIEQKLLAEEAAEERTEPVDPTVRTTASLHEVRQHFRSDEAFQSALRSLGLDEQQLAARMALQENTLRRIEQRFRPSAWPAGAEIEAYYRDVFVPELARQSQAAPPALSEVEDKIREILVEKKIDDLLGTWLKEMKSTRRVKVHDF